MSKNDRRIVFALPVAVAVIVVVIVVVNVNSFSMADFCDFQDLLTPRKSNLKGLFSGPSFNV